MKFLKHFSKKKSKKDQISKTIEKLDAKQMNKIAGGVEETSTANRAVLSGHSGGWS